MDVNGSRFHLLQGAGDWLALLARQSDEPLWWDEQHTAVSLAPRLQRFPQRPGETPPSLEDRRGAACDRFGNLHWLDTDRRSIRVLPGGTETAGPFWDVTQLRDRIGQISTGDDFQSCLPPSPPSLPRLRGLTITSRHYLIVGTLAPAGLLSFDLHAGGPPDWRPWPVPFAPFDMAPAADGGVWILDRGPQPGEARIWRLDRYFRVIPARNGPSMAITPSAVDDFKPLGSELSTTLGSQFPLGVPLGDSASPVEVAEPVAIVALPDDSVLILETDPRALASVVHRYRDGRPLNAIMLKGAWLEALMEPGRIRGHDMAFLPAAGRRPGRVHGELYIVAGDGNQAFVLGLEADQDSLSLFLRPRYLPLRRFTGKALVEAGGEVLYDLGEHWPPLTALPRRQFQQRATLAGLVLDGKQPDTVWHRLLLDACIPPGDSVVIETRSANEKIQLEDSPWQPEPPLYRRTAGSELPYHTPFTARELERRGTGTWELLFQNARGRFLELRLTLQGSGRSTPRLRALRVWYPRFSYLKEYLPAVYQDDPLPAGFLDRWLANPEGLLTTLEGAVADAQVLLDSRTAPAEYLDWLAGWLGALLEPDWDEQRRRLFIDHIELLFRWRGTPMGLLALIRLLIDPCPDARLFDDLRQGRESPPERFGGRSVRIVEGFLTRRFPGVSLGDPRRLEQPGTIIAGSAYEPSQGPDPLHRRFRDFLGRRYSPAMIQERWGQTVESIRFPPLLPDHDARAADWREFVEGRFLGFTYAVVDADDRALFQAFLARRYRLIDTLNQAYLLTEQQQYESFDDIPLPVQLPENLRRLTDWIGFVSLAMPIQRNAHRFTVLVPADPGETEAVRQHRLVQVRGIVAREKPAHTVFDVQPFWALFQVGGARLGLDTILGEGSRYMALVLGKNYLSGGFLAPSHPWNVRDRRVAGRDALGAPPMESEL